MLLGNYILHSIFLTCDKNKYTVGIRDMDGSFVNMKRFNCKLQDLLYMKCGVTNCGITFMLGKVL